MTEPAIIHPDAKDLKKTERTRLARAELWLLLAVKAEEWANDIDPARIGDEPADRGVIPFEQWGDDLTPSGRRKPPKDPFNTGDPFVDIANKYGLDKHDVARILGRIGDSLEARALASGYDQTILGLISYDA